MTTFAVGEVAIFAVARNPHAAVYEGEDVVVVERVSWMARQWIRHWRGQLCNCSPACDFPAYEVRPPNGIRLFVHTSDLRKKGLPDTKGSWHNIAHIWKPRLPKHETT